MTEENSARVSFLYSAISDAQELIRFCDTKTAIAITILASYVIAFFTATEKIVKYHSGYSLYFWAFLTAFFILLIICIIVTTRIIKPTNNPVDNIIFGNLPQSELKYFLSPNDYKSKYSFYPFYNSKKFKLKEKFDDYSKVIMKSTEVDIINSLVLELEKVSYIRNIKNDRFNVLLCLLFAITILFIISYLFFIIETQTTIDILEKTSKHCVYNSK